MGSKGGLGDSQRQVPHRVSRKAMFKDDSTTPCSGITGGLLKLNHLFSVDYVLADSP